MKANELYELEENVDDWLDRVTLGTWTRNPDGTIDVDGNVKIPFKTEKIRVKFNYVSGDFDCFDTRIKNLDGSPTVVEGLFNCSGNINLKSLSGGPRKAGKFHCTDTNITSLKGGPELVDGYFNCNNNGNLISLEGSPKFVGSYNCEFTNITSLEGSPKKVVYDFQCYGNSNLKTLKGAPEYVGGDFYCRNTKITSLEGMSKHIGGNFDCTKSFHIEPFDYRYALFSIIEGEFECDIHAINRIVNEYGYDGTPSSKRNVAVGLNKIKKLIKFKDSELGESAAGRIVKGVNTTDDVKPGETQRQAKKFGFRLDKHNQPPSIWDSGKVAARKDK